jgi:hypothetical protein
MKMSKGFLFVIFLLLVSCKSTKLKQNFEYDFNSNKGLYYVTCNFFPKNSHPMMMGGVGNYFDIKLLDLKNSDDFLESFYLQLAYLPIFFSNNIYKDIASCLGYEVVWTESQNDISGNILKNYKINLSDNSHVYIEIFKLSEKLDVKYSDDYKGCLDKMKTSIDFKEITEINNIKKIAVLVDKQD